MPPPRGASLRRMIAIGSTSKRNRRPSIVSRAPQDLEAAQRPVGYRWAASCLANGDSAASTQLLAGASSASAFALAWHSAPHPKMRRGCAQDRKCQLLRTPRYWLHSLSYWLPERRAAASDCPRTSNVRRAGADADGVHADELSGRGGGPFARHEADRRRPPGAGATSTSGGAQLTISEAACRSLAHRNAIIRRGSELICGRAGRMRSRTPTFYTH